MMNLLYRHAVRWPILALLALTACGRAKIPTPDEAGFVGPWTLAQESYPSVERRAGRKPGGPSLKLEADGTARFVEMPVEDPFTRPEYRLESGSGTWRLSLQQRWMLTVTIPDRKFSVSYHIVMEGAAPAALYHPVHEPDSQERWTWRKAPPHP